MSLSPIFFSCYSYSSTIACVYLTSDLKVLTYTTHMIIAKLYSFTLRSKVTNKQCNRSEISLDNGLVIFILGTQVF